ncbi:phosphatase PAP2 family protein [Streptomyces sp. KAU_LT]|uniref:phosphatase PAP2 family protein n=1 Tax=Streptomyces sp. KAU_LT TaxID=3046669 RepID=UPI0024B7141C|nr:phosphatase PAP2 family protein [Streptomyces sp. KAU_LT]MDI9833292.1 phosphatase PAP2 family protein [Streptomyces sp. KAU_LT]
MPTPSVASPPRPSAERAVSGSAGALALASALLLALVALRWHPLMALDGSVADTTHRWAVDEPGLTHVVRILTDWVWDPWTMRFVTFVAAIWLVWRRAARWTAIWLVVTCALATLVQQTLKAAVDRPRPAWPDPVDSAHFAAYPSGHAMTATVVCGLLLWLLHRYGVAGPLWHTAVAVAAVSVIGVGLTRIWLGVHWTSDVLGGWLLGALVVTLAVGVDLRRTRDRAEPADEAHA